MDYDKIQSKKTSSASNGRLNSTRITKSSICSKFTYFCSITTFRNIVIYCIVIVIIITKIIMPSVQRCCHCPKRIGTKERRFKISEPSLLPHFKTFVGEGFNSYDESSHVLCQKCRMKVLNATTLKKVEGKWTYGKTPKSRKTNDNVVLELSHPTQKPSTSMQPLPTNILCGTNIIQETEPDNEDEDFNEDIRDVDESNHTLPEPMDHCSKLMSIPQNSIGIQVDFNMFSASEVTFGESQPSLHSSMMSQSSGASSTCHISRIDAIPATEACCFLCKSTTDRAVIPKPAIQQVWSELSIFVK
jgi:hypothetical protein